MGCWCVSCIVCVKMSNKHRQTVLDLDQKITALLPCGIVKMMIMIGIACTVCVI